MRFYVPTLSPMTADFLWPFGSEEATHPDVSMLDNFSLAGLIEQALGGERISYKDVAWRLISIDDGYNVDRAYGIFDENVVLCAIATLGDREIIFTCDC